MNLAEAKRILAWVAQYGTRGFSDAQLDEAWWIIRHLDDSVEQLLMDRIREHLTDDLLSPKWRHLKRPGNPTSGHCYVAAETLYHLLGGKEAGYTPYILTSTLWEGLRRGDTHWFICKGEEVFDPTAEQFDCELPYSRAKCHGFLTKQPSKRTQILIRRIAQSVACQPIKRLL